MEKKLFVVAVALSLLISVMLVAVGGDMMKEDEIDKKLESESEPANLEDLTWPSFGRDRKNTGRSPYNTSRIDGIEKWNFSTENGVSASPAIGENETIYVGSGDNNLYAVYPDGTEKWNFSTGLDLESSPAIASDGTIYVGSQDNNLYAINPDGTEKWNFSTGNDVHSSPAIGSNGTVYIGSTDDSLYAVYPENGTEKWNFSTGNSVYSSPAIGSDGTIYIGSQDDNLYAVNPDGTEKWNFSTGYDVHSSPAIDSDGTIYVGSRDQNLYAINPNGTEKWNFSTGDWVESSPAIGENGTIYVGSRNHNLYAINPDGTEKWSYTTGGDVGSSPAIGSDGTIYVGSMGYNLYAVYPENGTEKWHFTTGDSVSSSPAIGSDGTIYIGSQDNDLYAIGGTNGAPKSPTNPSPPDGETGTNTSLKLSVNVSDPDGNIMDVTFYNASNNSSIGTDKGVVDGNTASITWTDLAKGSTYHWYAVANDYQTTNQSDTWSFTTVSNLPPEAPSSPSPSDGTTGVSPSPELNVTVVDPDGNAMNVMFYNASDDSLIGTDYSVKSGDTASFTWSSLAYETTYQWYAVADDGQATNQSSTWSFTTETEPNNAPDAPTNPSPADGATGINTGPTLSVDVSDPDGDPMNVTFYNASDDSQISSTQTGIADGGTASVTWSSLSYDTTYDWYAVADDGQTSTQSSTWSFTTQAEPNSAPAAPTNPSPSHGATDVGTGPTLSVDVSDPDGDSMTVTFYDASDNSQIGQNTGVTNGTTSVTWSGLPYSTTYNWYVVADDAQASTQSSTWSFTTMAEPNSAPATPTNPSPDDGATEVSTNPTLSVDVSDPDGDPMDVTFYAASDNSEIGTVTGVESGSTASITWSGLSEGTTYDWYAVVDDGTASTQSSNWSFTTEQQDEDTEDLEAVAEANRTDTDPGDEVSLNASGSTDNDEIVSYTWTIDGENYTGKTIEHAFEKPGEYEVTLTVEDAAGNTDTDTITITVEEEEEEGGDWLIYLLPLLLLIPLIAGLYYWKNNYTEK